MHQDFAIKEFEMLRTKMDQCIAEFRALERNALLASAAVYSFGFTSSIDSDSFKNVIFWVPLLIALLGAARAYALRCYVELIGKYIYRLEKLINNNDADGYEHYLSRSGTKTENIVAVIFWSALVVFNIFVLLRRP